MAKKRIVVVVNKWWECDPIMNLMLSDYIHPTFELGWPSFLNHPHRRPNKAKLPVERTWPIPRAIFTLSNIAVEVWCVSDFLEHLPDGPDYQSSSKRKIEQLPKIFAGHMPDLVIAIGTAAFPSEISENGNVVVGSNIFLHNADPQNLNSNWDCGPFDTIITSTLSQSDFAFITSIDPNALERFLVAPLNRACQGKLIVGFNYVALGTINVTDPQKYSLADKETRDVYGIKNDPEFAKSLETTHGLIRVQSEAPFVFVSGIANRVGHFADEVNLRSYTQNTTVAHNAGVVLTWMIPKIDELFSEIISPTRTLSL